MPTKTRRSSSSKKRRAPLSDAVPMDKSPSANQLKADTAVLNKPTRISALVRRMIVQRPEITLGEISDALINLGWKEIEITRRWSTISTLRSDALTVLALAREHGWVMQGKAGHAL